MTRKSATTQDEKNETQSVNLVKSAARALQILELLANSESGMILRDISRNLDIPISSVHSLINTLVYLGYVIKEVGTSNYKLGLRLPQIAAAYQADSSLISIADPVMKRLRNRTEETACLSVLQNDTIILIHKRSTESSVQVVNAFGSQLPAHATGSGKVMLAYLTNEEIDRIYPTELLPRYTSSTIVSKKELTKILETVRESNFAFDNEESIQGVWAAASCIRNIEGRPIAGLSIVAPSYRVTNEYVTNFPKLVVESTKLISGALGFNHNHNIDIFTKK